MGEGAQDSGDGVASGGLGGGGQEVVSDAVSRVGTAVIRGVFTVFELVLGGVGFDLAAPGPEKRAEKGERTAADFEGSFLGHAAEPGGTGAAEEILQDGLGLVFGVVGEIDAIGAVDPGGFGKAGVAGTAGGELQGNSLVCGESFHVFPDDVRGIAVFLCELLDEAGVGGRGATTEAVVEVNDDEFFCSGAVEQVQQNYGIPAARDGDEGFRSA